MNLEFWIEFEHENGEKHSLKLEIPKTLMESSADELEAIEASRSTQYPFWELPAEENGTSSLHISELQWCRELVSIYLIRKG